MISKDRCISKLEALLSKTIDITSRIIFYKEIPQHSYLMMLHCTIIELSSCCIELLKIGQPAAVPVVARSILEAYANAKCLLLDEHHWRFIHAGHLKDKAKLTAAAKSGNHYLADLSNQIDIDSELSAVREELATLKAEGIEPINHISKKFEKAGMEAEYKSMYELLCNEAHSSQSALVSRHLEEDGNGFKITLFKEQPIEDVATSIDVIAGILAGSTADVVRFFSGEEVEEILRLREEIRCEC
jgi:Family of unknown function (DUF5677)